MGGGEGRNEMRAAYINPRLGVAALGVPYFACRSLVQLQQQQPAVQHAREKPGGQEEGGGEQGMQLQCRI